MPELFVRSTLPDLHKPEFAKDGNHLTRLENRQFRHFSAHSDELGTDELRLHGRLPIFKEHLDDFSKVCVQFIERLALAVCSRKAGDKPDVEPGFGRALDDCGVGLHA